MKLYLDNVPMGDVPGPALQPGEFFPRLVGFRISSAGNWADSLEPVYIPALRLSRRAGQVMIELNSHRPLMYITLQARRPFLHIFRFPWREWDKENL